QFSFAKGFGKTFANSVIVDRPDIGPTEIKEKKHRDCRAADAAHGDETRDDLIIAHRDECASDRYRAIECFRSEILYRGNQSTENAEAQTTNSSATLKR